MSTHDPADPGVPRSGPALLRFGPFVLDRAGARLLRDGLPVEVAPRPWQVLCVLAERPGQLVTKDGLLDAVWGHRFVSDSVLKVAINALRRSLGEDAREAAWIQTVARRGYRFTDAVEVVPADRPPAAQPPATASVLPAEGAPASGEADAPPAATPVTLGNLPHGGEALLGRARDREALLDLLGRHRLLTLTGPGGVGKTCLALQVAAQAAPVGGVWLVRLDAVAQAGDVGPAVARTLGLGDSAGHSTPALAQALAARPLRLVLDSAEHLVDGLAPQVVAWVQRAPALSVLVTSQRPLRAAGEQVVPIGPLPAPAADAAPDTLPANPAVCVLVRRVQALQPGWVPAASELADCAAIARALDGLPLALELAAARMPLLGTAGVRQRLDARLRMLTGGRADGPERQRTLRAALAWTVGLLPPMATQVLARVSVFAGGFTAEAAQAVATPALPEADEWAVLDALDLLRDLALVATQPAPPHAPGAAAALPRLRLLESVRLLAAERLAAEDGLAAAQAEQQAWLQHLLAAAEPRYFETGVARWLAPLEPEADNLVAVVAQGLQRLDDAITAAPAGAAPAPVAAQAAGLATLLALATHFCLRIALGRTLKGWRDRLDACLARGGIALPPPVQAHWWLAGALLGGQGLVPMAQACAWGEQAVQGLCGSGQPQRLMMALYATGLFQQRMGRRQPLDDTLAEMRGLLVSLDRPGNPVPAGLRRLEGMLTAVVAQHAGDLATYERFWSGVLAESQAQGDSFEAWRAAWSVGQARFLRGDAAGAAAVMDPAIDAVRAAGRLPTQLGFASQALLMRLVLDAGPLVLRQLRELVPMLQTAGMLFDALGDGLAWVPLHQGRLDDARRIQAWADARVAVDKVVRSPVVRTLRAAFDTHIGTPVPADPAPLDEAGAIRLALAGPPDGAPAAAAPVATAAPLAHGNDPRG